MTSLLHFLLHPDPHSTASAIPPGPLGIFAMLSPQGLHSCLSSISHLHPLHCSSCRNLLPVPPVSMHCLLPSPLLSQGRPSAPASPPVPPKAPSSIPHTIQPRPSPRPGPLSRGTLRWQELEEVLGKLPGPAPEDQLCPCLSISWAMALSLFLLPFILRFSFLLSSFFCPPTCNRCTATWLKRGGRQCSWGSKSFVPRDHL